MARHYDGPANVPEADIWQEILRGGPPVPASNGRRRREPKAPPTDFYAAMARRTVRTRTLVYRPGRKIGDAKILLGASASAASEMMRRRDREVGGNGRFQLLAVGLKGGISAVYDLPCFGLSSGEGSPRSWCYEALDFAVAARALGVEDVALAYWRFHAQTPDGTMDILSQGVRDLRYHHIRVHDIVICGPRSNCVTSLAKTDPFNFEPDEPGSRVGPYARRLESWGDAQ